MSASVIKLKTNRPYQICSCCVMDTADEDIVFDSKGCMRCNEFMECTSLSVFKNSGEGI